MSAESTKVKLVDPFNYKKKYGFSPAIVVENVSKTIYVSGQCSMDQDGNVVNQNDFDAQIDVVFQNIEKVLKDSGAGLENIVMVRAYLIDLQRDSEAYMKKIKKIFGTDKPPASTLLQISKLALDGFLIEVDAIAVL